ncbi:MAG: metallophosphoesterase, partial [Gammaproteobacteria bacterium]|nr:metallophosphoesterase [Gammaproteobacteria bacterium]
AARGEAIAPDVDIKARQLIPDGDKPAIYYFNGNPVMALPSSWADCNIKTFGDVHANVAAVLEVEIWLQADKKNRAICLGDYVDRGDNLGVLTALTDLKVDSKFSSRLLLLRGNHDQATVTPEDARFKDALPGDFWRVLIGGQREQQVLVQKGKAQQCTIALPEADLVVDKQRLDRCSRMLFEQMPVAAFLPIPHAQENDVGLLSHGAACSRDDEDPNKLKEKNVYQGLMDLGLVLNSYAHGLRSSAGDLGRILESAGCCLKVCGHSHGVELCGGTRMPLTEGDGEQARAVVVNSATFADKQAALLLQPGKPPEFVMMRAAKQEDVNYACLYRDLEVDAKASQQKGDPDLTLTKFLTLTHPDLRAYQAAYAIAKATQESNQDLAIAIGKVYLSVLDGDYAAGLSSLDTEMKKLLPARENVEPIFVKLRQAILHDDDQVAAVIGADDVVGIKFPNVVTTEVQQVEGQEIWPVTTSQLNESEITGRITRYFNYILSRWSNLPIEISVLAGAYDVLGKIGSVGLPEEITDYLREIIINNVAKLGLDQLSINLSAELCMPIAEDGATIRLQPVAEGVEFFDNCSSVKISFAVPLKTDPEGGKLCFKLHVGLEPVNLLGVTAIQLHIPKTAISHPAFMQARSSFPSA